MVYPWREETLEPAACTAIALGETMESLEKLNVERTCTLPGQILKWKEVTVWLSKNLICLTDLPVCQGPWSLSNGSRATEAAERGDETSRTT